MHNTYNKYRPDIDGLRAIAVIIILLFHAEIPGFKGGFIGVDIFFVISGYLISKILLNDSHISKYNLLNFYLRRIKRIFPSLLFVKFIVIIICIFIYDPENLEALGKSVIASNLFLSNVYFWKTTGYFDNDIYIKPLIHLWSLSVEEQFYLLFPIILIFCKKYFKNYVFIIFFLILVTSFCLNIFCVQNYPSATYFLILTRAWEILTGALLSLKFFPLINNTKYKELIFLISVILIVIGIYYTDEKVLFPGYIVLFPIIGAVSIIYNGINFTSSFQNILKNKFLIFTGKISYPLYLWHWPIISIYKYLNVTLWTYLDGVICIILSFLFAFLTWKFIELPIYKKQKGIFLYIFLSYLIIFLIGLIMIFTKGMPNRVNSGILDIIKEVDKDEYRDIQNNWEKNNSNFCCKTIPTIVGTKNIDPSFALIGDSHARALIPAFAKLFQINKTAGYIITMSSTPPLIGYSIVSSDNDNGIDENRYNTSVLNYLKDHVEIKTIILTARWGAYLNGNWKEKKEHSGFITFYDKNDFVTDNIFGLKMGLESFIKNVVSLDKNIIILTDVPEIGYDVPSMFWINSILPMFNYLNYIRPSIQEYNQRQGVANKILEEISSKYELKIIHLENMFYDNNQKAIIINKQGLLYRDNNHLSKNGSLFLIPMLNRCFND